MLPELPVQFHFLRPEWFWALLPAALLLAAYWRRRLRQAGLARICDPLLLPHLLLDRGGARAKRLPLILLALAWLLTVTALAGPVWQKQPQPVFRLEEGRVLVLDLSPSMAATDVTPSRLERARYKIEDILKKSREGRTGLVVFSAEPHVVVPLTDDVATITSLLPALAVNIMPQFGDSAGEALEMAATLLRQGGLKGGEIILVTDGMDDLASCLSIAAKLRGQGVHLSVLGVGGESGAPVPAPEGGGFEADGRGASRLARLDPSSLRELAVAGGGRYATFTADERDIDTLLAVANPRGLGEGRATNKNIDRWQEEGVWLVLPVLALALAAFRRGWLLCLLAALILRPEPAGAMSWQDLWQRPDQQAAKQLAQGNPAQAAKLFTDPAWRAVAQHQAGNYQDAIETGRTLKDGAGQYNLGNSLARAGQLQKALAAYDAALKLNPDDADAKANRELVQKISNQQQQKQNDQQQQDQQQGNTNKQQDKKDDSAGNSAGQQRDGQQKQQPRGDSGKPDQQDKGASAAADQSQDANKEGQQPGNAGQQKQKNGPSAADQAKQAQPPAREATSGKEHGQDQKAAAAQPAKKEQQVPRGNGQTGTPASEGKGEAQAVPSDEEKKVPAKQDLVLDQWLRQVPDDPSGLLRRKFMLEHQRRQQGGSQP